MTCRRCCGNRGAFLPLLETHIEDEDEERDEERVGNEDGRVGKEVSCGSEAQILKDRGVGGGGVE